MPAIVIIAVVKLFVLFLERLTWLLNMFVCTIRCAFGQIPSNFSYELNNKWIAKN